MIENDGERLSALYDDELSAAERTVAFDAMLGREEMRQRWARYQLVGDAIRGQLPARVEMSLPDRVSHSLRDEPAVLVRQRAPASRLTRPIVGLALAASVVAAAILVLPELPFANRSESLEPQLFAGLGEDPDQQRSDGLRWTTIEPEVAGRLNQILVHHTEFAPSNTMIGMFPYATLVGYEPGR